MDIQTSILTLAAKKVAKEASRKDLAQLNALLRNNPDFKTSLKNLFDHWDDIYFENTLEKEEIDENLTSVLTKIQQQINMPYRNGTPGG